MLRKTHGGARIMTTRLMASVLVLIVLAPACEKRDLRGTWKPSPDGRTYLVIDDDYGACPLELDGYPWTAKKGVARLVPPGVHDIACRGTSPGIRFDVREGTTFHFDYWGP
jgi:hypothetical protein